MTTHPQPYGNPGALVHRLRHRILAADLACDCREDAVAALDRMASDAARDALLDNLAEARRRREAIRRLIDLLADLDDLGPDETDPRCFDNVADLLDDIVAQAAAAASAVRRGRAALPVDEVEVG